MVSVKVAVGYDRGSDFRGSVAANRGDALLACKAQGDWVALTLDQVSPSKLSELSKGLLKIQELRLYTVRPSSGLFLCPKAELGPALRELLRLGCSVDLSGAPWVQPSLSMRSHAPATRGIWQRGAYLRLQVSNFFLEVPLCKAAPWLPMEASRGGVLRGSARQTVLCSGVRLFEGDEDDADSCWQPLEDQERFAAFELQSEQQIGVWLFVGKHFARMIGARTEVLPREVKAMVGEVSPLGRLQRFQEGHTSVIFDQSDAAQVKDGVLLYQAEGRDEHWKVHSMTFNPFAPKAKAPSFTEGSKVKYWSVTVHRWVPATVQQKNEDGTYRLDLKKRALLQHLRWPDEDETPPPPAPPKGLKRKEPSSKESEESSSSEDSPSSSSEEVPKRSAKKSAKGKKKKARKGKAKKRSTSS